MPSSAVKWNKRQVSIEKKNRTSGRLKEVPKSEVKVVGQTVRAPKRHPVG